MATTSNQHGTDPARSERYWFVDVWQELRPFLVRVIADFSIFSVMWMLLFAAHALTAWLPLRPGLSWLMLVAHEIMLVTMFGCLSFNALWQMIGRKRRGDV